jgi:hypothetical protein
MSTKQRRGISQAQAPEQNADTSTSTSTATGGGGPVMGPSPEAGAPEEDVTETAELRGNMAAQGVAMGDGGQAGAAMPGGAGGGGGSAGGGGGELPFKEEMEEQFGEDFSNVTVQFGMSAQLGAMNANAAASGETVMFSTANPSKKEVAHELTHIVQARRGGGATAPQFSSKDVSSPSDDSEREASSVGARVAAGGQAGPITASPDAAVQRDFWDAMPWGTSDADQQQAQGEYTPTPERREEWYGVFYVYPKSRAEYEDEAKKAKDGPKTLKLVTEYKKRPVKLKVDYENEKALKDAEKGAVLNKLLTPLDAEKAKPTPNPALAYSELEKVIQGLPDPEKKLLPHLHGDSGLFGHEMMIKIQQAMPQKLLDFAKAIDPGTVLKKTLAEHATDQQQLLQIIGSWAEQYPMHAPRAAEDADILGVIAQGNVQGLVDDISTGVTVAAIAGAVLNPLVATAAVAYHVFDVDDKLAAMLSDENALQINALQLLMNKGAIDEESPETKLQQAMADEDEAKFLEAWREIVRNAELFKKFQADPVFMTDVEAKFSAEVVERIRNALKAGPADSEATKDKLTDKQITQVETISAPTVRALVNAFSGGVIAFFAGGGVVDSKVIEPLTKWQIDIQNILAESTGEVTDPKKKQAQRILRQMFADHHGKDLSAEISRGLEEAQAKIALKIIGAGATAAEASQERTEEGKKSAHSPLLVNDGVTNELDAVKGLFQSVIDKLKKELEAWLYCNDSVVVSVLQGFEADVDGIVKMPADKDPQAIWAVRERRKDARVRLEKEYNNQITLEGGKKYGWTMAEQMEKGMSRGDQATATTFFATAKEVSRLPDDPTKYSEEMSEAERAEAKRVARGTATKLNQEFAATHIPGYTAVQAIRGVEDDEVVAILEAAQGDLRVALRPKEVTQKTRTAYDAKVDEGMKLVKTVYDATYGSLAEDIDSLTYTQKKERCLQLVGARAVPTKDIADEALAGVTLDKDLEAYQQQMAAVQREIEELAYDFDAEIGKGGKDDDYDDFDKLVKQFDEIKGIKERNDTLENQSKNFTAPQTYIDLLLAAFRPLGGDLAYAIANRFEDTKEADRILGDLGLGTTATAGVPKDPKLVEELKAAQARQEEIGVDLADTKTKGKARKGLLKEQQDLVDDLKRLERQIATKQQFTLYSRELFTRLEAVKDPAEDEEEVAAVRETVEKIGTNTYYGDHIWRVIPGKNGAPPKVDLDIKHRLLLETYHEVTGIQLEKHLGRTLKRCQLHQDIVNTKLARLRLAVVGVQTPDTQILGDPAVVTRIEDELKIDPQKIHTGFDLFTAGERAKELMGKFDETAEALKGMSLSGTAIAAGVSIVTLNPYPMMGYIHVKRGDKVQKEAELKRYIARMGGPEELRVINKVFEEMYGYTPTYRINQLFGIETDKAESFVHKAEGDVGDFARQMKDLAAAERIDDIYTAVYEAKPEEKQALLASGEALAAIRSLGPEVYDRVYKSATGKLTLGDMLRTRDEGSMLTLTIGTDEEGMKADIASWAKMKKAEIQAKHQSYTPDKKSPAEILEKYKITDPRRVGELAALNPQLDWAKKIKFKKTKLSDTLNIPPWWVAGTIKDEFEAECRKAMDDPEIREILSREFNSDDWLEMRLLVNDAGALSATHQVLVDMEGWGTSGAIIENLKAMSDGDRAAAAADPQFVSKLMHDLDGDQLQEALDILHHTKGEEGLADITKGASGYQSSVIDFVDEDKIFSGFLSLDAEGMRAFAGDTAALAEIQMKLDDDEGDTDSEAQMFNQMMDAVRDKLKELPKPKDPADAQSQTYKDRLAAEKIEQRKAYLVITHTFRIRRACFDGADKLMDAAQQVYNERGEMDDPFQEIPGPNEKPLDKKKKLFVFETNERDEVWNGVNQTVTTEYDTPINKWYTPDIDAPPEKKTGPNPPETDTRTYANLVDDAIHGTVDPATARIGKGLSFSNSEAEIKDAISKAGSDLVINEWSNIIKPGDDGKTLERVWKEWALARQTYTDTKKQYGTTKDPNKQKELKELEQKKYLAERDFRQFHVTYQKDLIKTLQDGEYNLLGSTDAELLGYKEVVHARIMALTSEQVAAALGIADEDKDYALEKSMDLHEGANARTVTLEQADIDLLMSQDRKDRSTQDITHEKIDHQVDGFSIYDGFDGDKKLAIADAGADYDQALYAAEEGKTTTEGTTVGTISEEESADLKTKLAAIDKSIADYKAAKNAMADAITYVIAAIAMVVTALVSGPAGPSLIASFLIATTSAAATVLAKEAVQGNDYDLYKEGLPYVLQEAGKELITMGLSKGWGKMCARWPGPTNKIKNIADWWDKTVGEMGEAWGQLGAVGTIVKETVAGGVVAPIKDAVTGPLLHLISPNALKYGWTSAEKEALAMWSKNAANLPEEIQKKSFDAFLASLGKVVTDKVVGEEPPGPTGVPGVEKAKPPPPVASLWASIKSTSQKELGMKAFKRVAVEELWKLGVVVIKSDKLVDAFDDVQIDQILWSVFKGRMEAFYKGVSTDYAESLNKVAAYKKFEKDKALVGKLKVEGMDQLDEELLHAHYKWFLENGATAEELSDMTPAEWSEKYWPDVKRRIDVARRRQDKEKKTTYREEFERWALSDPGKLKQRLDKSEEFEENYGDALAHQEKQRQQVMDMHLAGNFTEEQGKYASEMLSDPTIAFDVVKGEATGPDLTTAKGLETFNKSYLLMKQSTFTQAYVNEEWSPQKKQALADFLAKLTPEDWAEHEFMPSDDPRTVKSKATSLYIEFNRSTLFDSGDSAGQTGTSASGAAVEPTGPKGPGGPTPAAPTRVEPTRVEPTRVEPTRVEPAPAAQTPTAVDPASVRAALKAKYEREREERERTHQLYREAKGEEKSRLHEEYKKLQDAVLSTNAALVDVTKNPEKAAEVAKAQNLDLG